MKHIRIKRQDGKVAKVHFQSPVDLDGTTLCGSDMSFDVSLRKAQAKETESTVTCDLCQTIVYQCKEVHSRELSPIRR